MLNVKIYSDNNYLKYGFELALDSLEKVKYHCSSNLLILDTTHVTQDSLSNILSESFCLAIFIVKDKCDENLLQYISLPYPVFFITITASIQYISEAISLIKNGLLHKRACYVNKNYMYHCWMNKNELTAIAMLFEGFKKENIASHLNISLKSVHNLCGTAMKKLSLKWSTRTYELFKLLNGALHIISSKSYRSDYDCAIINLNMRGFQGGILK